MVEGNPSSILMSSGIKPFHSPFNRRGLLKSMAVASAGWTLPGAHTGTP